MFYLGKKLITLVNRFGERRLAHAKARDETKLGFTVEALDTSNAAEQFSVMVPRAIAKAGAEFAYVLGSGISRLTSAELKFMEATKAAVIEELSKSTEDVDLKAFNKAKEIAARELSLYSTKKRADYLAYFVAHDTVGYGPFSILLEDKQNIEEIEVNAPCAPINVYHTKYGRCATNIRFTSEAQFRHSINKLICDTDKELSEGSPIIDAQVAEARIHAQLRPYALSGAVASIRIGSSKVVGLDYLIDRNTTTFDVLAYVWLAIESKRNMVIAGAPASGKTTLLSALFFFIPRFEKMITIEEEINEIKARIEISNTVALYGSHYGGVSTKEQVINALRMRPNRLIVGEVRGDETRELFSSANLGVPFITTMHSNSGGIDIIKKLLVKPMSVESRSLSMLDVSLYMRQIDISKRLLSEIYEYRWLSRAETDRIGIEIGDGDAVEISNIVNNGKIDIGALQNSKVVEAFSKKSGLSKRLVLREFERRAEFLRGAFTSGRKSSEIMDKVQSYGW